MQRAQPKFAKAEISNLFQYFSKRRRKNASFATTGALAPPRSAACRPFKSIFDFYQRYKQMSEKSKVYFDISQRMQCILEIVSKIINFYIKHTTQTVPHYHFKHHATPPGKHLMPQQPTSLKKIEDKAAEKEELSSHKNFIVGKYIVSSHNRKNRRL